MTGDKTSSVRAVQRCCNEHSRYFLLGPLRITITRRLFPHRNYVSPRHTSVPLDPCKRRDLPRVLVPFRNLRPGVSYKRSPNTTPGVFPTRLCGVRDVSLHVSPRQTDAKKSGMSRHSFSSSTVRRLWRVMRPSRSSPRVLPPRHESGNTHTRGIVYSLSEHGRTGIMDYAACETNRK